jgi:hypothetical protein
MKINPVWAILFLTAAYKGVDRTFCQFGSLFSSKTGLNIFFCVLNFQYFAGRRCRQLGIVLG